MQSLNIYKIGGNCIDDEQLLSQFVKDFSNVKGPKILVHGGGKSATNLSEKMGLKQHLVDGRRITDANTLKIIVMVYAGWINKSIVAQLQMQNCDAIGFSGADGNLIKSRKRTHVDIDFGEVGDVISSGINIEFINSILLQQMVPVICPVTHDGKGHLLNSNADGIAAKIAMACSSFYKVNLHYCFEKKGVLIDPDNSDSALTTISMQQYIQLKEAGIISKGMIPKLDYAFEAFNNGVTNVSITHANLLDDIGTQLVKNYLE